MREAIFNIWAGRVPGCAFLDLFAGSGAMGLEAVSRGATRVTWVEKQGQAVATIRRNLDDLGLSSTPSLQVLRLDLPAQIGRLGPEDGNWDLIYADPPYALEVHRELARAASRRLMPGGELAIEHSPRLDPAVFEGLSGLEAVERRTWGDCAVTFLRPRSEEASS